MRKASWRKAIWAVVLAGLTAFPAAAEEDDAARAERWHDLRQAVFGDRDVKDGRDILTLDAPDRALDASLVPIGVTIAPGRTIRSLYLVIDDNPSPLAGTFTFGPAADVHSLKLRVRVDQYSLVHAVAEMEDGSLLSVAKMVKAAGGCSAPSSKDPVLALERLGQMKLKLLDTPAADAPVAAQLLISHPNNNGMQMDQISRHYVPARFIQDVRVSYNDALVFDFAADISLSEDPAITFGFVPHGAGSLNVEVDDSAKAIFKETFEVLPKGA
jgi:sulfur-oxidizing protein SoxY